MQSAANSGDREQPEKIIASLASRIRRQLLWDALSIFVPLGLGTSYAALYLARSGQLSDATFVFILAGILALGALSVTARMRLRRPEMTFAARLADEKAGAKDHFLTLSTIDPTTSPQPLVARLRRDAGRYGQRIDLKRDLPYRLKRSAYASVLASILLAAMIHLVAPLAESMSAPQATPQQLVKLAQQLAEKPGLGGLARELEALAALLSDPEVSADKKKTLMQEMEKKLEQQLQKERAQEQRDMLAQAAEALGELERQRSSSGDKKKEQQKGAGGLESNLPQDGRGESKQSEGGGGESHGERSAQLSQDMKDGQSAKGTPKQAGGEKDRPNQGDAKSDKPDSNRKDQESKNQQANKEQGGSKEGAGPQKTSEEPPHRTPPEERFYKAGEGKEGIKGAQFVTVQLPEEIAADYKGEGGLLKGAKAGKVSPKLPVSNVPLPPHLPNAPREKQPLPLEYRGLIR